MIDETKRGTCPLDGALPDEWWDVLPVEKSDKTVTILLHDAPPVIVRDVEWPSIGRVSCGGTWMEARQNVSDPKQWIVYGMISYEGKTLHVGRMVKENITVGNTVAGAFEQISNMLGHRHLGIELIQAIPPVRI